MNKSTSQQLLSVSLTQCNSSAASSIIDYWTLMARTLWKHFQGFCIYSQGIVLKEKFRFIKISFSRQKLHKILIGGYLLMFFLYTVSFNWVTNSPKVQSWNNSCIIRLVCLRCWVKKCLHRTAIDEKLIIWVSAKVNFGQKPFDLDWLTPAVLVAALVRG